MINTSPIHSQSEALRSSELFQVAYSAAARRWIESSDCKNHWVYGKYSFTWETLLQSIDSLPRLTDMFPLFPIRTIPFWHNQFHFSTRTFSNCSNLSLRIKQSPEWSKHEYPFRNGNRVDEEKKTHWRQCRMGRAPKKNIWTHAKPYRHRFPVSTDFRVSTISSLHLKSFFLFHLIRISERLSVLKPRQKHWN